MFRTLRPIWVAGGLLALLIAPSSASAQWIFYPPYPGPVYVSPPVQRTSATSYGAPSADEDRPSYYSEDYSGADNPDAPLDTRTAEIRVRLPERAELWSNGKKTKLTGAVREFVTPRLDPERVYTYVLKARWLEDGMTVEKTLRVRTFAGNRVTVNFVRRPAVAPPPPTVVRAEPPGISLPPADTDRRSVEWSNPPRSFGGPSR